MKLKTVEIDGKTYAEVQDGKPLFEADDGKTIAFDAPGTAATISRLNGEARGHREAKEAAERALKSFEGIADPSAALKALDIVKNLDDKKLVDAGQVEQVKAEAARAFEERARAMEEKYKPVVEKAQHLEAALVAEKVGGSFARSKFIAEKMAIPPDMVQARFGETFKLEGDKVVAYGRDGRPIYSRANPGEIASFDEALELVVESYPYRDHIMKGSGASGGGAQGGSGGNSKSINRAQFDTLPPADRMAHIKSGGEVHD
jgi:Family of unknown function (DUF6651)